MVINVKLLALRLLMAVSLCALGAGSVAADRWHHGGYRGRGHEGFDRHRDFDRHQRFHRHWGGRDYDGFRGNFGLYFGSPFYTDPFYWNDYPRYQPPVYYAPPQPRVYIQKSQSAQYWYWCGNPAGYYPYVKSCPTPWQRVVPYGTPRIKGVTRVSAAAESSTRAVDTLYKLPRETPPDRVPPAAVQSGCMPLWQWRRPDARSS